MPTATVVKSNEGGALLLASPLVAKTYAPGDMIRWVDDGSVNFNTGHFTTSGGAGYVDTVEVHRGGLYKIDVQNLLFNSPVAFQVTWTHAPPPDASLLSTAVAGLASHFGVYRVHSGTRLQLQSVSATVVAGASQYVTFELSRIPGPLQTPLVEQPLLAAQSDVSQTYDEFGRSVVSSTLATATYTFQKNKIALFGWVAVRFTGPDSSIMLGFSESVPPVPVAAASSNGILMLHGSQYRIYTGGTVSVSVTPSAVNHIVRLRRVAAASMLAEISADNGTTWSTVNTWSTSTGTLYVQIYQSAAGSKCFHAKGFALEA